MATVTQAQTQEKLATQGKDILQVLEHLPQLLPLKKRQQALPPTLRTVHRTILRYGATMASEEIPLLKMPTNACVNHPHSLVKTLGVISRSDALCAARTFG